MKYGNQFKPTTPFVLRFLLLAKSRHIHSILHESCSQRSQTIPQTVSSNCNFPQSRLSSLIPAPQAKAHSHSATTVHNCQLVKHLTIEVPSPFRAHEQHENDIVQQQSMSVQAPGKQTNPARTIQYQTVAFFPRRLAIHSAWEQYSTLLQVLKTNQSKSRSFKPNEYSRKTLQRSCRCPTFTNEIPHLAFLAEKSLTVLGTLHDSGIPLYCSSSIRVSFHRPPMFPVVQNTFIQTE